MYDVLQPNQTLIAETCNVFRQLTDIYDSWGSVIGMIDYFGDDPQNISQVARPGAWNDPDQVTPVKLWMGTHILHRRTYCRLVKDDGPLHGLMTDV